MYRIIADLPLKWPQIIRTWLFSLFNVFWVAGVFFVFVIYWGLNLKLGTLTTIGGGMIPTIILFLVRDFERHRVTPTLSFVGEFRRSPQSAAIKLVAVALALSVGLGLGLWLA